MPPALTIARLNQIGEKPATHFPGSHVLKPGKRFFGANFIENRLIFSDHFSVQKHFPAVEHLLRVDKTLGRVIRRVGPCLLKTAVGRDPYTSLVRSVAYQQLTGKAAATILGRVQGLFPADPFPTPRQLLDCSDELLRGAGLSRAKTAAIKDIAAKTIGGLVPTRREIARLANEEIIERLTAIRGVGPWTVEMLLIFTLGRPDVLPATDYGVRKGFALTYGWKELPTPAELLLHGEIWRPYRTVASWYLWRSLELPDKERPVRPKKQPGK